MLKEARRGEIALYISPAALIEVSLILRTKGINETELKEVLDSMRYAISMYTKPRLPHLSFEHVSLASNLRSRYPELSFFDSIHASIAILNGLLYYDLDKVIKEIVEAELSI